MISFHFFLNAKIGSGAEAEQLWLAWLQALTSLVPVYFPAKPSAETTQAAGAAPSAQVRSGQVRLG